MTVIETKPETPSGFYPIKRLKKQIFKFLSVSEEKGDLSWYFDLFLIVLISLNVIAIVLESIAPLQAKYEQEFYVFELCSVVFFSIEYILRVWTANEDERYRSPVVGNLKYMCKPIALIDLFSILPFYLPLVGIDLRVFRILRLLRLFRLFKLIRYIKAIGIINNVLKEKRQELIVSIIFVVFMLLMTSTVMYYVENELQPEKFSSIPETMWWSIATLTTVGYGDVYPLTGIGKLLGGIIAVLGVGLFALPTGIIVSGFTEALSKDKLKCIVCPNCNHEIKD